MAEFIALDRVDPWGEWRADLRSGVIASTIANVNRGKKAEAFTPKDFMPYWRIESERQRMEKRPKGKALSKKVRGIFGALAKKKGGG